MPLINPTNKLVRRTYTDEKGNQYYTTHKAGLDYNVRAGEQTDRFGRKFTEAEYNPSAAGQIARGAAPSALGAAVGAMAGGLSGNVGAASGLGGAVNAGANVVANRLNARYGGSKAAAVGAGALSTGASTFAKAFQSGVSRTGSFTSGLLSGLMGAGQGAVQGAISAVPGGKTIGNSVGQVIGGGMSGGLGGAARGFSQGTMTSPTLGQDTANLLTKSNAGNYLENTWGKGMTDIEEENKLDAQHAEAGTPQQENFDIAPAEAPQGEPPGPHDVALPQGPNAEGHGSIQEAYEARQARVGGGDGMPGGAPVGGQALAPAPRPAGEPPRPAGAPEDADAGGRPFALPAMPALAPVPAAAAAPAVPAAPAAPAAPVPPAAPAAPVPPAMPAAPVPPAMPVAPPMPAPAAPAPAAGAPAPAAAAPAPAAAAPAAAAAAPAAAGGMAEAQQRFNRIYGTDDNPTPHSNIEAHRQEAARLAEIQNPTQEQRQALILHRRRIGRIMHNAGLEEMARRGAAAAGAAAEAAPVVPPAPGPGPAPILEPLPPPPRRGHIAPAQEPQGEPPAPPQRWLRGARATNVMAPLPPPAGVTAQELRDFNRLYGTPSNPTKHSTPAYHQEQIERMSRMQNRTPLLERHIKLHQHRLAEFARRAPQDVERRVRFAPLPAAAPAAAPINLAGTLPPRRGAELRDLIRREREAEAAAAAGAGAPAAAAPAAAAPARAQYLEDIPQAPRRPAVPAVPQFPDAGENIVRDEISPVVRNAFKQQYGDLDALKPSSTIEAHRNEIERLEGANVPLTDLEQQRLTLHRNRLEELQNRQDPFRNMPQDAYENPNALERLQTESERIRQQREAQSASPAQVRHVGIEGDEAPDIFSMNGDELDQEIENLDHQIEQERLERGHRSAAEEVQDAAVARGVTDLDWQKNAMPLEHYLTHPDNEGKYVQLRPTRSSHGIVTDNFNDLPETSNFNVANEHNTIQLGDRGDRYFRTKFGPLRAYDQDSEDTNGSPEYKAAISKLQSALLSGDDEKAKQYYNDIHRYDRGIALVGSEAVKNHAKVLKDFSRQLTEHGNNPASTPAELDAILEKAQQHMLTHIIGKTGLNGEENSFQSEVPDGEDRSLRQRYLDIELQHALAKRNKEEAENRGWGGWFAGKGRRLLNRVTGNTHRYFYPKQVKNFMSGTERDMLGALPTLYHPRTVQDMNKYNFLLHPEEWEGIPPEYLPSENDIYNFEGIYGNDLNPNQHSTLREHTNALQRLERESGRNKLANGEPDPTFVKQMVMHAKRLQKLREAEDERNQQRIDREIGRGIPV